MFSNNDSNMIKILNGEKKCIWVISRIYFVFVNQIGNRNDKVSIFKFRIRTEIENYMWNIGHKFSESLQ